MPIYFGGLRKHRDTGSIDTGTASSTVVYDSDVIEITVVSDGTGELTINVGAVYAGLSNSITSILDNSAASNEYIGLAAGDSFPVVFDGTKSSLGAMITSVGTSEEEFVYTSINVVRVGSEVKYVITVEYGW